jgi:hypothetical protein
MYLTACAAIMKSWMDIEGRNKGEEEEEVCRLSYTFASISPTDRFAVLCQKRSMPSIHSTLRLNGVPSAQQQQATNF